MRTTLAQPQWGPTAFPIDPSPIPRLFFSIITLLARFLGLAALRAELWPLSRILGGARVTGAAPVLSQASGRTLGACFELMPPITYRHSR
jgi:hypothetical protein